MDSEFIPPGQKNPEFTDDQKAEIHSAMIALGFTEVGPLQYKKDPLTLRVDLKVEKGFNKDGSDCHFIEISTSVGDFAQVASQSLEEGEAIASILEELTSMLADGVEVLLESEAVIEAVSEVERNRISKTLATWA